MLFIQKGNSQFDDHAAFSCIIGRTQEEYLFLQGLVSLSWWISQEFKLLSILYMNITKYFQICSLGEPQDSGISLQTVLELGPTIPIFGVCMGLQCIGEAFGGNIYLYTSSLVCSRPDLFSLKPLCTWICRKDYPCSFWSDAWKKLSSLLRWGIRKGLIQWLAKVWFDFQTTESAKFYFDWDMYCFTGHIFIAYYSGHTY